MNLPRGWVALKLTEISSYIQRGKSPQYTEQSLLPVVNQKCIRWFNVDLSFVKYIHDSQKEDLSEERFLREGDILWNSTGTGTIGRAAIWSHPIRAVVDSHVTIVRVKNALPKYVLMYISSKYVQDKIEDMQNGSTNQVELSKEEIAKIVIPLPPLNEQKRIVAKLEELLGRVRKAREALAAIPPLLEKLKQSVLAAAFRGDLTRDWRAQHPDIDFDWPWVKIKDFEIKVGSGATPKGGESSYTTNGIPLIRSMNIHFDGFSSDGLVFLNPEQAKKLDGVAVKKNDVLLNITGASIGRTTIAPIEMEGARVNQHVCIIRLKPDFEPEFVSAFLSSQEMQKLIMSEESGATRQALTKAKILDFELPKPSTDEQKEIIRQFSLFRGILIGIKNNLEQQQTQLDQLEQSILTKAFQGELVEQDPNDEPASLLLERLRAEASTQHAPKPKTGRGRPPSANSPPTSAPTQDDVPSRDAPPLLLSSPEAKPRRGRKARR